MLHMMWYNKADRVYMIRNTEWTQPANQLQDGLDYGRIIVVCQVLLHNDCRSPCCSFQFPNMLVSLGWSLGSM